MNILLTGGTGYIGSHTAVALVKAGHKVVLFDNLSNSSADVVDCLEKITQHRLPLIEGDIRETDLLIETLRRYEIEGVIHFAGVKAVGESVEKPLDYYDKNVSGSISLLKALQCTGIRKLVFSSSATVYGNPQYLPIDEEHPTSATNPYGRTKLQIEEILKDLAYSDKQWKITCLRYFNPAGAHSSGLIGECPKGIPNNLIPHMSRVAAGRIPFLKVYGGDYKTRDGTGVRDYIHVMDLAEGHLAALNHINKSDAGFSVYNLGTGNGASVLEVINAFEFVSDIKIAYQIMGRREGDIGECYASTDESKKTLNWSAKRDLIEMCSSEWNFQNNNVKAKTG